MIKKTIKSTVKIILSLMLLNLLTACGGGGGGGTTAPIADISGTWNISDKGTSNCSGEEIYYDNYDITVSMTGNDLSVTTPAGYFTGTINGDKISWTGSYAENFGTTTINSMSLTVTPDGNSLSGSSTWSWTDGNESCSGTSQTISGSREPGTGPAPDDTAAPTTPSGFTVSADNSSPQININWFAASDNVSVAGYKIFRTGTFLQNTTNLTYSDSGLSSSTRYCYTLLAYDTAGNESSQTAEQCATTISSNTSDTQSPTTPGNLTATAASSSQINLRWSASSDNVGVTSYNIYRNSIFVKSVITTSTSDTGLIASTNYCYSVRANDAAGNYSSQTTQVCRFTQAEAVTAPAAPSNIIATNITHNSAKISWTDNSNNENGFEIGTCSGLVTSTGSGYSYCSSGFTRVTTVSASPYTFSNLTASRQYYYYVRAYNSAGVSANRQVSFMTSAAPVVSTLKITNNLSGTGSNKVLQLRLGATEAEAKSDSNELLSPDNTCVYLGPKSIQPNQSATYDVNSSLAANGYSVFIGLGIMDGSFCEDYHFEKKMWSANSSTGWNTLYIYETIIFPPGLTNGKSVELRLGYDNNNNLATHVYINGIFNITLNFVSDYSDPTTN